ncbi:MAG: glycosyltransferase family 4 protein [Bacteroidota bacterium]|nr:glycosyltransferase family 4 protein [Ignavibacteria bacterium]MCU7498037.1 glycosyltransferase family 4 protein [Ignavibacteria bacterium]MCU7512139.1 glycosyltransferase family 4 protein [Ignavibacteria bacterium]MCU7520444.1 glycosyltransferase family 4 protein [Ignavibacteria bacterium]MCU7523875.1 glycosyltransferase family 4 protein [Ignavibacteria bacterium]
MSKNICMVVLSSYPYDPRVRRQAEVLEEEGYHVDVICLREAEQAETEKMGLVTVHRIMRSVNKESILRYVWLSFMFSLLSIIKMQTLAMKKDYRLIQVHNMPDFLIFTGIVQKMLGKKLILDIHDLTVDLFETKWPDKKKSLMMSAVRKVEKLSCSFADHLITVTEACRDKLVERGVPPEKITLVLNTADTRIFQFDCNRTFERIESGARLLYHGTVAERFGIHTAIEALALLQNKIPRSTLHIYGKYDTDYRIKLEGQIRDLGLEGLVFLNGARSLEEIYEIIKKSDLGLVPYVDDPYMNLALSTKTFEYAATGLPVIASNLYSLSLIFDQSSIKFARADKPEAFADAIAELCLSPEKRMQISQNANEVVSAISGTVMGKRYLNLVESLGK